MSVKHLVPRGLAAVTLSLVALALATSGARADTAQTRRHGDAMQLKLRQIAARGEQCPCTRRLSTTILEAEVNGYLRHHATDDLPEGVVDPHVTILGGGRLLGRATVDLDRVRTSRQRGWLDPAGYLAGKLPVTAIGILHTVDGKGKFELETATVGGVTVPKAVLQEMLSYYSRSSDDPDGLSLDDVFELPANILEIQIGTAVAYVIQ